jgi:hypothetical protein
MSVYKQEPLILAIGPGFKPIETIYAQHKQKSVCTPQSVPAERHSSRSNTGRSVSITIDQKRELMVALTFGLPCPGCLAGRARFNV